MAEQVAKMQTDRALLVVDDSKTVRRSIVTLFEPYGYRVHVASDGFTALALLANVQPEMMLLDVMLPRLDGFQVCAAVRQNQSYHSVPIVLMSSRDGIFDFARGRLAGASHYLRKPFKRNDLQKLVSRLAVTDANS